MAPAAAARKVSAAEKRSSARSRATRQAADPLRVSPQPPNQVDDHSEKIQGVAMDVDMAGAAGPLVPDPDAVPGGVVVKPAIAKRRPGRPRGTTKAALATRSSAKAPSLEPTGPNTAAPPPYTPSVVASEAEKGQSEGRRVTGK
jgi:hypothetical protein